MIREVGCSDKETLVGYIYGECDEAETRAVERHLAVCPVCADEVAGFGTVRQALTEWTPPARVPGFRLVSEEAGQSASAKVLRPARWWRRPMPGWARAAAAVLLVASGAALANVDVRYDKDGVTFRTGWRHPSPRETPAVVSAPAPGAQAPWQADLAALERRMRDDFRSQVQATRVGAAPVVQAAGPVLDERQLMARMRALVDDRIGESERRQQNELAYRLADLQSDVATQRHADLLRVQQGLGQVNRTGAEVLQQRQLLNYLLTVAEKK